MLLFGVGFNQKHTIDIYSIAKERGFFYKIFGKYMLFIECLKNIMDGTNPVKNEIAIESKFKKKFP